MPRACAMMQLDRYLAGAAARKPHARALHARAEPGVRVEDERAVCKPLVVAVVVAALAVVVLLALVPR
eukprot:11201174-Lingulodinium_polyedra.AAC.1